MSDETLSNGSNQQIKIKGGALLDLITAEFSTRTKGTIEKTTLRRLINARLKIKDPFDSHELHYTYMSNAHHLIGGNVLYFCPEGSYHIATDDDNFYLGFSQKLTAKGLEHVIRVAKTASGDPHISTSCGSIETLHTYLEHRFGSTCDDIWTELHKHLISKIDAQFLNIYLSERNPRDEHLTGEIIVRGKEHLTIHKPIDLCTLQYTPTTLTIV